MIVRFLGTRNMEVVHTPRLQHGITWTVLSLVVFLQSPGQVSADTKLDLVVNPAQFLGRSLSAWTDAMTMGQLQNQAYGYLFPQGLFFLLMDPLPDWLAQRTWWLLCLGLGFSGALVLLQRLGIGSSTTRLIAALLYGLSPRTLGSLTTISSEVWPVALAPWALLPLVGPRPRIGYSILAIACMGAVNATATLAAIVPAGVWLLWHRTPARTFLLWCAGVLGVSVWWIIPLLILGAYAAPFTDYIEDAATTTAWLYLPEILRGSTTWVPYVDHERAAAVLYLKEPVFIVATLVVAALGLLGLSRPHPARGYWLALLAAGLVILGAGHYPAVQEVLDGGAGTALRNMHKFDLVVRLPLAVGVAALSGVGLRLAGVGLVATVALAPAWSGRLLPLGTWDQIPPSWVEAARAIDSSATRTLILPKASFARQDWGWTRDEPLQALSHAPFAVRDAIPLTPPEMIRQLDGVSSTPTAANLARMGIGQVLLRHDLEGTPGPMATELFPGYPVTRFGGGTLELVTVNPTAGWVLTDTTELPVVSGGGEALALLKEGAFVLGAGGTIATDTPRVQARHYGTLLNPVSAIAHPDDDWLLLQDYDSAQPATAIVETGGRVLASSSADDPRSFGGARAERSVAAAVDNNPATAWFPRPGTQEGQWLELQATGSSQRLVLHTTETVTVDITTGAGTHVTSTLQGGKAETLTLPGAATSTVRMTLRDSVPAAGIIAAELEGAPIRRLATLPDAPNANAFVFHQEQGPLDRGFSTHSEQSWHLECTAPVRIGPVWGELTEYRCGDTVTLPAGQHQLRGLSGTVTLTAQDGALHGAPVAPTGATIAPAPVDRYLITGHSFNAGHRATLEGVSLQAVSVGASTQAYLIPAGKGGTVTTSFAPDAPYRWGLGLGGLLALCTILVAARGRATVPAPSRALAPWMLGVPALLVACGPIPGALALVLGWAIPRYTLVRASWLIAATTAVASMWLVRAPWPEAFISDQPIITTLLGTAIAAAFLTPRKQTPGYQSRHRTFATHPPR